MLGNRKLVLDTFCEVYDLLKPWADEEFWEFSTHEIIPGAVYLIGRQQINLNRDRIVELINNNIIKVIFSNPAEGSDTIINHCTFELKIKDLLLDKKISLIVGGDVPPEYPHLLYENFLPKVLDYNENYEAIEKYWNNYSTVRPYKFLFLNGRVRLHRRHMLERLSALLDQALWTNLDLGNGSIKLLDSKYEFDKFNVNIDTNSLKWAKSQLFGTEIWGDIYIEANPYIDTYFSLVSETVHRFPYSFRTEKIWKPVAIGHPFIAIANQGYYRDLHNLGFKTFGHVVDESFDQIENNMDRMERVATVVEDLCQQDLASFLNECYNVCKYNQQCLKELRIKVRKEFPQRFEQYINERFRI
jgi:hypothetical protein